MADWRTGVAVTAIVAGACVSSASEVPDAPSPPASTTTTTEAATTPTEPSSDRLSAEPAVLIDVPDAVAINLSSNGTDPPVVAWISDGEVTVASLDLAEGILVDPLAVNDSIQPFAHPIERPAVVVHRDATVDVAFTSLQGTGGSVFRVHIDETGPSSPTLISGEPEPETNLVHMTLGPDGQPAITWLEDSTLSVATLHDGGLVEAEDVDELTCDCCNPVPVFAADRVVVAFRDLSMTDRGTVRNVSSVASDDGGATFGEVVPIADDDWLIAGCPFTGPSVVTVGDRIVVGWMDARQSVHPDQRSSSIWVDESTDGAVSFGADVEITREGINRWPVLAADPGGVIHVVWERRGTDGALYHASSSDGGVSFSAPRALVSDGARGARTPSIIIHQGLLIATWTTPAGGHIASWSIRS